MRTSFFILLLFILGIFSGLFIPGYILERYDPTLPALWLLMGLVGLNLGARIRKGSLRLSLNPALLLLPLSTTIGTFAGATLAVLFVSWSLTDCLAIASGFAYYSLSSVFITKFRGADPGAAALICNILRELFTLLFVPVIVRFFGSPAAISSGGATTMDTTLPIILRYAGIQWAIPAVFHAVILDISVPFWVTLFCSLN